MFMGSSLDVLGGVVAARRGPRTLGYDREVLSARQAPAPVGGLVLIVLAAISWGTSGSVMTVLGEHNAVSPLLVGTARLWVAALLLVPAAAATGAFAVAPGDRWRTVAMGACMAAYQGSYFVAVTWSGIAVVALVAICSAPLMIAALAPSLLGERLSARGKVALGLGVVGTALLVAAPSGALAPSGRFLAGMLLALVAGLAYALWVLAAKASLARSAPLPVAALTFAIGAVLLTPVLVFADAPLRQLALGWPWFLYLGGIATAGAYAAYTFGLRRVPASVAGVATLLEPLTATVLGVTLFGERLGVAGIVGALLLLTALALLVTDRR
jgi:DME family drug/metabolite transporter